MPETSVGLDALARAAERRVQAGIQQVFGMVADQVGPLLAEARNLDDLAHRITLDWPVTIGEARSLTAALGHAVSLPAQYFVGSTPLQVVDPARLAYTQSAWAKQHGAELVGQISSATQTTLARSLSRSLSEGAPLDVVTNRIRRYVGLDDRYARAVDNYRQGLLDKGTKPGTANRLARSYAARLRTSRAHTIAQTETTRALWEGEQQYFDQLINEGVIDSASLRKRWKTHRDEKVCPVCKPLHNSTISYYDKWTLPMGEVLAGPPAHPNCRCEVTILWSRYVVSKAEDRRRALAATFGFTVA